MKKILKVVIWAGVIVGILFAGLLVAGFYRLYEKNKTTEAIFRINAKKITLDDVMGKYLPPKPEKVLNDLTAAGFDVNNNSIRDDVELLIFEKYPNSAKIRSAMLQYAQALQLQLVEVFNSKTLIATIRKESFAYGCLGKANDKDLKNNKKIIEDFVINTDLRKEAIDSVFKYMTTYSLLNREYCDVNFSSLPN